MHLIMVIVTATGSKILHTQFYKNSKQLYSIMGIYALLGIQTTNTKLLPPSIMFEYYYDIWDCPSRHFVLLMEQQWRCQSHTNRKLNLKDWFVSVYVKCVDIFK